MPVSIRRFFMSPSFQVLTRPVTVRTIEIIDSMQFVFVNDRRRAPVSPDYGRERLVLVEQLIVNIAPLPRRPGASIANRLESRGRL